MRHTVRPGPTAACIPRSTDPIASRSGIDAILTSFPGLPAAFSFFVPRADTLGFAALVLLVTGSLAGLYPAWLASRAPIAATLRAEAT